MSGRVQRCRHGRDKMWAKFYCQQRGDRQLGRRNHLDRKSLSAY
jgi:hypothetical protein